VRGVGDFWQVLQGYGLELPPLASVAKDLERRLAQTLLEARLRELAIADYAPDWIFAFDDALKLVCCNVSSLRILGFVPSELVGRSLSDLLLRPSGEELRKSLEDVKQARDLSVSNSRDGREHRLAMTVISKSGALVDLDMRCEWSNR